MKLIFKVDDNDEKGYSEYESVPDYTIPKEGWTDCPYPQPAYSPKFDWLTRQWVEDEGLEEKLLEQEKEEKTLEMNAICKQEIIKGFNYNIFGLQYHFSYDIEAQINFQDTYNLFQNNLLETIGWTVSRLEQKERIQLTKVLFSEVYAEAMKHKNECLNHLYEVVLPKVKSSETIAEAEAIQWGKLEENLDFNKDDMLEKQLESISVIEKETTAQKGHNSYMETTLMEVVDIIFGGI